MIVVQNHIPVNEKFKKEFEDRFRKRNGDVDKFPGFLSNKILKPVEGNEYIVMTFWNSMDDFKAWVNSEEFKKAHSGDIPDGMFDGKSHLTIHEVIINTEKTIEK
ncbi:antibiotic biosynthesis monooxygenase family protein [Cuniculiplasma sp. SKW4]|uniref:antibiotic biosynthesis monooxygenase family protein n=1 Tax=Cuniculiplasma sp. SKW4 TaxID=3400171 RepID=UPI003FCEF32F